MWSDSKQPFAGHGSTLTKTSAKGWRAAVAKGRVMRGGTHYALFDLQKVRHAYLFNSRCFLSDSLPFRSCEHTRTSGFHNNGGLCIFRSCTSVLPSPGANSVG